MGWFDDYWNYYPKEDKIAEQYAKELLVECRSAKTDDEILAAIAKIKSDTKARYSMYGELKPKCMSSEELKHAFVKSVKANVDENHWFIDQNIKERLLKGVE